MKPKSAMYETIVVRVLHSKGELNHAVVYRLHVFQRYIDTQIEILLFNVLVHVTFVAHLGQAKLIHLLSLLVLKCVESRDNIGMWR